MQNKPTVTKKRKPPTGIEVRHSRSCRTVGGGACNCVPTIRAWVYDRRNGVKVRKTFAGIGALAAAKAWRSDATAQQNHGKQIAPSRSTLRDAAEAWIAGAEAQPPTILNRSGLPYKPSALREYVRNLRNYILDDLGAVKLSDIRRGDLQQLVDKLQGRGLSGSKIRNIILPVRVIYRHALERDEVAANPTSGLRLPNGHKPRDRAADVAEAAELLGVLPVEDRALWATAFYAGLRRGELQALRFDDVDLAAGLIHVRRGWDEKEGEILPKSSKGTRSVPITPLLRDHLDELKIRTERSGTDFVFGRTSREPFTPSYIRSRAAKAWEAENKKRAQKKPKQAPLVPIGLHECRHTFVSLMHAAGISLERVGDYVGHSSTYMTDRYRHLLKGQQAEDAKLLGDYLARADTAGRVEQLTGE